MTATQLQPAEKINDGRHDFDFFFGSWRTQNHRLVGRLQGSTTWEDFESTCAYCQPVLNGLGNIDEYHTEHWPDFKAMTLRLFSPETRQWSIFWIPSRTAIIEPPVMGSFSDGVGIFEGPDTHDGKPIIVRFIWSDITPTSARWEQAFSPDNGQTWEVNWTMTFTRIAE